VCEEPDTYGSADAPVVTGRGMPLHGVTRPADSDSEVIVCVSERAANPRLRDALPSSTVVRTARTNAQLDEMLRAAGDRLRMVIISPRDETGAPTASLVREFRQRRPRVAIVGYCRAAHEQSQDIIALATAGIHEIVFLDVTDWGNVLRQTFARAAQSCGATVAFDRLAPVVPGLLQPLIEYCLYFPQLCTSVPRVAAALGVHRKTLVNYTQRFGLPGPSVLITWCRLIIAAHLLETRGGAVERVALALEYPSATALRNTLRRYSGHRPADLRRHGMDQMIDEFACLLARGPSQEPKFCPN
jgi:AraC-like DNA-binding protein